MMTSFNMIGASLTLLKLDDSSPVLSLIDTHTDAKGWIHAETRTTAGDNEKDISDQLMKATSGDGSASSSVVANIDGFDYSTALTKGVEAISAAITTAEPNLTEWDLKVGDGDCGITMKRGANALLSGLEKR